MADLLTGFMYMLGAISALFFVVLTVVLAVLLISEWRHRRKPKAAEPEPKIDIKALSDEEIRRRLRRAALDLDLWTRTALLRDMEVDLALVKCEPNPAYPRGWYHVHVDMPLKHP